MRFRNYKGDLFKIIAIEYFNGLPHALIAESYKHKGAADDYDCFYEGGDPNDLKLYNSGGQGTKGVRLADNYVNPEYWQIWTEKGYEFIAENAKCEIIERPLFLSDGHTKSINPFIVGEEAFDSNYCGKCDCYYEELCSEHLYYDKNGDVRYKGNHKIPYWY